MIKSIEINCGSVLIQKYSGSYLASMLERDFVKDKKSQVIITTHSPYLLDLLHLSQIVFVERKNGNVVFNRPYDFEQLRNWSKEYTPGEMYRKDLIQQIIK